MRGGGIPHNYLFKNGTLMTSIITSSYGPSGWGSGGVSTYTVEDGLLKLNITGIASFFTDEIDVTNVNSITITITYLNLTGSAKTWIGMTNQFKDSYSRANNVAAGSVGTYTVNTSNLTGNYRLYIAMNSTNANMYVSEIYMNLN